MFHSSGDFWWYDTNGKMLQTAYAAAGIALGFSGIVVLFSSRSVVLTLISIFTIGYVLIASTALLVASGWALGFLESICFAILIGISCDFMIHFGHAYAHLPGHIYPATNEPRMLSFAWPPVCWRLPSRLFALLSLCSLLSFPSFYSSPRFYSTPSFKSR